MISCNIFIFANWSLNILFSPNFFPQQNINKTNETFRDEKKERNTSIEKKTFNGTKNMGMKSISEPSQDLCTGLAGSRFNMIYTKFKQEEYFLNEPQIQKKYHLIVCIYASKRSRQLNGIHTMHICSWEMYVWSHEQHVVTTKKSTLRLENDAKTNFYPYLIHNIFKTLNQQYHVYIVRILCTAIFNRTHTKIEENTFNPG